jgi:GT2 family glycosyltransferase
MGLLFDGRPHRIEVREAETGFLLPGSPRIFQVAAVTVQPAKTDHRAETGTAPCILFDTLVGAHAYGWSTAAQDSPPSLKVCYGGAVLGMLEATIPRPDVQRALGLSSDQVGYDFMAGGLLHFSVGESSLSTVQLRQTAVNGRHVDIDLARYLGEAYTFSPMRALLRTRPMLGKIRHAHCAASGRFSLLLETNAVLLDEADTALLTFYQKSGAALEVLGQFELALAGQLSDLQFDLHEINAPVLLVVTDVRHRIVLTDCISHPALFLPLFTPLIDYHSLMARGQAALDVAVKISRHFLDFGVAQRGRDSHVPAGQAGFANTALVLFSRQHFDPLMDALVVAYRHLAEHVVFLDQDGLIQTPARDAPVPLLDFLAQSRAEFYLMCEVGSALRPDFWAMLDSQRGRIQAEHHLIYWDSIWVDGAARNHWVRNEMLADAAFGSHRLAPVNALLVSKALLVTAVGQRPAHFRSGEFMPEQAFGFAGPGSMAHLPLVMDTWRRNFVLAAEKLLFEQQYPMAWDASLTFAGGVPVSELPPLCDLAKDAGHGVSIIINYRNSAPATIECLRSIRLQRLTVPLEVVLVNNGSSPGDEQRVLSVAHALFGAQRVTALNYVQRFNHSAQCNLGMRRARYDYLLMLSNDSLLVSEDAIARSMELVAVPWVATCGFRVVGERDGKFQLQSLGLKLADGKYLLTGCAPLATSRPPEFLLDYTIGAAGNTFAAVMMRKEVYLSLGGLDEQQFPADYNDVDFCLRASGRGYRHLVIGACAVLHVGRGTREMNLDIPVNPQLLERVPALATLAAGFAVLPL